MAEIKYEDTAGNLHHRIVADERFEYQIEDGLWIIKEDEGKTSIPDEQVRSVIYTESDEELRTSL